MRSLFGGRSKQSPAPSPSSSDAVHDHSVVQVRVVEARGLKPMDSASLFGTGASDPYVVLQLGEMAHKTKVQKGTLEPVWEEEFDFEGIPESHELVATCYDWDRFTKDDPMGRVAIPTIEMAGMDDWYPLQPMAGCEETQGELRLVCNAVFPPDSTAALKIKMHRKKQHADKALRERSDREAAERAAGEGGPEPQISEEEAARRELELQAAREEEEAQQAEENANREEEEARLAEEAADRERAEAEAAQEEALVQEEEARLAQEKKLAEERDVRLAEERLEAAIAAGASQDEIEAARADLAREQAEAEAAAAEAAREAQEAAEAAAVAEAEMAEANAATELAEKERIEADSARLTAMQERAEADAAKMEAVAAELAARDRAKKLKEQEEGGGGLSRASEVGGGYNDNGHKVHRGRKSGGGTRPFSAPLEFKYYCGRAMPGGPLEPTQEAFEAAEKVHKKDYLADREGVFDSDAGKAANGDEELVLPFEEELLVGSHIITIEEEEEDAQEGEGIEIAMGDDGEMSFEIGDDDDDENGAAGGDIDIEADDDSAGGGGGGGAGGDASEGKTMDVAGVVGVKEESVPDGFEVVVDEEQGNITVIKSDYPADGWEEELKITLMINPIKRLDLIEKARRAKAKAWYKQKMAVLRMEAAREWRRQPLGAKTVPGLNGMCGPYDGEQCPSCWRYQQALERDASHTQWRDTPAGRRTLLEERSSLRQAYSAQRLEPRQTAPKVIRQRRSRAQERAAFALSRRASRKHPMEQLQAAADELLQLSGRIRKRSTDSLSGTGAADNWLWKPRWMQLIELPQGRETRDRKPHKFGKPHQRPKPNLALEYRQHSNSKRVLGIIPLSAAGGGGRGVHGGAAGGGGWRLILRAGSRGDRLLDLHAEHIPRDSVAYAAFDGFVVCGVWDDVTLKRGEPSLFMASSSKPEDVERTRRWYEMLTKLTRLSDGGERTAEGEDAAAAAAAAADEAAEAEYGDDDNAFEDEDEDDYGENEFDDAESSSSSSSSVGEPLSPEAQAARKRAAGPTYHLSACVTACKGLLAADRFGKNDVYVSCCLDTHFAPITENEIEDDERRARHRTTTCENGGESPTWGGQGGGGAFAARGETMRWKLKAEPGRVLIVEVWDEDGPLDGDDLLGKCEIPLDPSGEFEPTAAAAASVEGGEEQERGGDPEAGIWYELKLPPDADLAGSSSRGGDGKGASAGMVRLALSCWRQAGEAAGVGWDRAREVRTRTKVAAHVNLTTAVSKREEARLARVAKAEAVKVELIRVASERRAHQAAIAEAMRDAMNAGTKIDPMGYEEGHPSFYQPPPRTLYTAQGYVKDARNNSQGAEIFEGGSGVATGKHIRYRSGELRLMLDEQLDTQLLEGGAKLWNSAGVATSSTEQRKTRINRGLLRIPDPYPEDD